VERLKKFFTVHPFLSLTVLFLFTRLPNLTLLPVYIDESTYIDWGWRTTHISGLFFFPLAFYKMPLIIWLFGLAQYLVRDPLFAGRLIGILCGYLSFWGLFTLTKTIANLRVALITNILYLVSPIFVFFDRQALMESALSAAGIWSCYFLLRFVQKPKLLWSFLLGLSLGLACLTKANGLIFVPSAFIIIFYTAWKNKPHRYPLLTYSVLLAFIFLLVLSPVLFHPLFWQTIHNVSDFTLTPKELLTFPFLIWLKNLLAYLEIGFWYFTPLLFLAVFLGRKKIPVVTAWTVLTLILATFLVRSGSPRYLVPYLPPLLIFAAGWLSRKTQWLFIFLLPTVFISILLITNPPGYFTFLSRLTPYSQSPGYISGRNTGYQAMATVNYLLKNLPPGPVYVGVAANAGNPEQAVFNYLRRRPDTYIGYLDDHVIGVTPKEVSCLTASIPVYYVSRQQEQGGLQNYYTPVATVTNPLNSDYNTVYILKKNCSGPSLNIDPVINYYAQVL
jgi:4-amino-4-deoxy-L-arabinose transferase-like glycosyltransferase